MKKISFLLLLIGGLFAIPQHSVAQKMHVTVQTATKKNGYITMNKGEAITIYKYVHQAHPPKAAEKYAPKYYFSTRSSDILQPLTKMDLKQAFPANHAFHDALDATFKSDAELPNYDDFHKMYKINWLLKNAR